MGLDTSLLTIDARVRAAEIRSRRRSVGARNHRNGPRVAPHTALAPGPGNGGRSHAAAGRLTLTPPPGGFINVSRKACRQRQDDRSSQISSPRLLRCVVSKQMLLS